MYLALENQRIPYYLVQMNLKGCRKIFFQFIPSFLSVQAISFFKSYNSSWKTDFSGARRVYQEYIRVFYLKMQKVEPVPFSVFEPVCKWKYYLWNYLYFLVQYFSWWESIFWAFLNAEKRKIIFCSDSMSYHTRVLSLNKYLKI